MYAVIRTGGKQYRVAEGDVLRIEKISGDAGAEVKFDEILMLGGTEAVKVGTPVVGGAHVTGKILRQAKARRVLHFREEKEGWTRLRGHRQQFTEVKITAVTGA
jgi:large subunit ribosomal protein L21